MYGWLKKTLKGSEPMIGDDEDDNNVMDTGQDVKTLSDATKCMSQVHQKILEKDVNKSTANLLPCATFISPTSQHRKHHTEEDPVPMPQNIHLPEQCLVEPQKLGDNIYENVIGEQSFLTPQQIDHNDHEKNIFSVQEMKDHAQCSLLQNRSVKEEKSNSKKEAEYSPNNISDDDREYEFIPEHHHTKEYFDITSENSKVHRTTVLQSNYNVLRSKSISLPDISKKRHDEIIVSEFNEQLKTIQRKDGKESINTMSHINHAKVSISTDVTFKCDEGFIYDMRNMSLSEKNINSETISTHKYEGSKYENHFDIPQSTNLESLSNKLDTYSDTENINCDHRFVECLKNQNGTLVPEFEISDKSKLSYLTLTTTVLGKEVEIYVSRKMIYVKNGVVSKCINIKHELEVQFDGHIFDKGYYANVIWIGEKPRFVAKEGQTFEYYDVSAKYYGSVQNINKVIAIIDGNFISISVSTGHLWQRLYNTYGERINGKLQLHQLLNLHVRYEPRNNISKWLIVLAVSVSNEEGGNSVVNWPLEFTDPKLQVSQIIGNANSDHNDNSDTLTVSKKLDMCTSQINNSTTASSLPTGLPKCLINQHGTIIAKENENNERKFENFTIMKKISQQIHNILIPKICSYVENGKIKSISCIKNMTGIQFDAYLSGNEYHALVMWVGEKPIKKQVGDNVHIYYDVQCRYYGYAKDMHEVIVNVEGTFLPLKLKSSWIFLSYNGEIVRQPSINSIIKFHLKKTISCGIIKWSPFLSVVQPEEEKENYKDSFWPVDFKGLNDTNKHEFVKCTRNYKAAPIVSSDKKTEKSKFENKNNVGYTDIDKKIEIQNNLKYNLYKEVNMVTNNEQKLSEFPGYLQNWPGTLIPIFRNGSLDVLEHLLIEYDIAGCAHETVCNKERLYVNTGVVPICNVIKSCLKVQFDAHLNANGTGYFIVLIWIGEKPRIFEHGNSTKYFDIPAKYYGLHDYHQIFALVGDTFVPLRVVLNGAYTCFYSSVDKKAVSPVMPNSLLTIHLAKHIKNGNIKWKVLFAIVNAVGEKCAADTINWPHSYLNIVQKEEEKPSTSTGYYCKICDIHVKPESRENLKQHFKGGKHQLREMKTPEAEKVKAQLDKGVLCQKSGHKVYCLLCMVYVDFKNDIQPIYRHINKSWHVKQLGLKGISSEDPMNNEEIYAKLNADQSPESVHEAMKTNVLERKESGKYYCKCCQVTLDFKELRPLTEHLTENKHQFNLLLYQCQEESYDSVGITNKFDKVSCSYNNRNYENTRYTKSPVNIKSESHKYILNSSNANSEINKPLCKKDIIRGKDKLINASSTNFGLNVNVDSSDLPGYLKNWPGSIICVRKEGNVNSLEEYVLRTEVKNYTYDFPVSKEKKLVSNGTMYKCKDIRFSLELEVEFDAYINNSIGDFIITLVWVGEKPKCIEKKGNTKEYFDIPGKYCEFNEQHHIIIFLEDSFIPIKVDRIFDYFDASGRRLTSEIEPNSLFTMHLRKKKASWSIIQLVVYAPGDNLLFERIKWPNTFLGSHPSFINITEHDHSCEVLSEKNEFSNQNEKIKYSMDIGNKPLYNDLPKCLMNWHGTLSAKYGDKDQFCIKHYTISTKIAEKDFEIIVSKEESYFDNEKSNSFQLLKGKKNIKFDACLRCDGYHVMVIWTEDKPKYMSIKNGVVNHYDVSCKYYGCNENKYQLIAVVDGYLIPIELNHSGSFFIHNGEEVLPTAGDFLSSHLKRNDLNGIVTWSVIFSSIRVSEKGFGMFWPISFNNFKLNHMYNLTNITKTENKFHTGKSRECIDEIQLPEVLQDCSGTLIPIFCKDDPDIVEYCVLKTNMFGWSYLTNVHNTDGAYLDNGIMRNFSDLKSKIEVQFDAHITDDGDGYEKTSIWVGKKPNQVGNFYFDVPIKYYGFNEKHEIFAYIEDTFVPIEMDSFKVSNCYCNISDKMIDFPIENEQLTACLEKKQDEWKIVYSIPYNADSKSSREKPNWPQSFLMSSSGKPSGVFGLKCHQNSSNLPGYLKNWPATVVPGFQAKAPKVIQYYHVKFNVACQDYQSISDKKSFYVENGVSRKLEEIRSEVEIQFDAHLNNKGTGYIKDLLYIGEKPRKVYNNNLKNYYDIPGKYYGFFEEHSVIAYVEDSFIPITVTAEKVSMSFFNSYDKKVPLSILENSYLTMHLRRSEIKWSVLFAVIHVSGEKCSSENIKWPEFHPSLLNPDKENDKKIWKDHRYHEMNAEEYREESALSQNIPEKNKIKQTNNCNLFPPFSVTTKIHNLPEYKTTDLSVRSKTKLKKERENSFETVGPYKSMPQEWNSANKTTYGMLKEDSTSIKQKPKSLGNIENEKFSKSSHNVYLTTDHQSTFVNKTDNKNTSRSEEKDLYDHDIVSACSLENKDFLNNKENYFTNMTIDGYGFSASKIICRSQNHSVLIKRNAVYTNQVKIKSKYPIYQSISLNAKINAIGVAIPETSRYANECYNHQAIIAWQGKKPSFEDVVKHMPPRPEKVENLQVPKVVDDSTCISLNDTINVMINKLSFYINGKNIKENVHLCEIELLDVKICGLVLPLETQVEKGGITITHESVVTWQGGKPHHALCNFHILYHENYNYMRLAKELDFTNCKSMIVSEKNMHKSAFVNSNISLEYIRCSNESSPKKISTNKKGKSENLRNSISKSYRCWIRLSNMDLYINSDMISNAKDSQILYKSGYFLKFSGTLGFWRTLVNKNVVFHIENLYINNAKWSLTLEDNSLKRGKTMHGQCFELENAVVIDEIPVSYVCIIAYSAEMHLNVCNLIQNWKDDVQKTVKVSSKLFLTEMNHIHSFDSLQNREEINNHPKKSSFYVSKNSLGENPFLQRNTLNQSDRTIGDITGRVVKIMKNSILIMFSNNIVNVIDAIAQCSLSNIFLDGAKYGLNTHNQVISHLSSGKSLHGMVKKLDISRKVQGTEVKYLMDMGWIGRKPDKRERLDYGEGNLNQNEMDGAKRLVSISSAGFTPIVGSTPTAISTPMAGSAPTNFKDVPTGLIFQIEPTIVHLIKKDGNYLHAIRDRCFLYNVCLQAVNLKHVLVNGLEVEYEICKGGEVKGIWLPSSTISLSTKDLYYAMCNWCDNYKIPHSTRSCLVS
ncbi:unnamed protein product, partial [Meganyctiphanes norvegica]